MNFLLLPGAAGRAAPCLCRMTERRTDWASLLAASASITCIVAMAYLFLRFAFGDP